MNKLIDLADQRFGKLLVGKLAPARGDGKTRWTCRCDCGQDTAKLGVSLRAGKITHCGCSKQLYLPQSRVPKNRAGLPFGMLTALDLVAPDGREGRRWRCQCECGRVVVVRSRDLPNGNTRSCGCIINRPQVTRDGLSDRQKRLLQVMARQPGQQLDQAAVAGITGAPGTVVRNLDQLERKGLVRRHKLPGVPGKVLELLPAGRKARGRLAA